MGRKEKNILKVVKPQCEVIWLRQDRTQVPVQSMVKWWKHGVCGGEESKHWRQITPYLICHFPQMHYSKNQISLPFFPTTFFFPNSKSFSAFASDQPLVLTQCTWHVLSTCVRSCVTYSFFPNLKFFTFFTF